MRRRIFTGIFAAGIAVLIASLTLVLSVLYMTYDSEYARELKNEAYIVAQATEMGGETYLKNLELPERHRITWIDADGTVRFDSYVDETTMENHGTRPEFKEAIEAGYGEDIRYSDTLSEKTMYSAVKLKDGSVLRISQVQFTIFYTLLKLLKPIILIVILAIIFSFLLAARTAKKIVEPLNQIDVQHPEDALVYEEVRPMVNRIIEQNIVLNNQITRLKVDVDEKTKEADFRKEFTANVSHELKTPLTSISGFAELIKNGFVKPEDIQRFAGRIYEEAQRLIILVEDIIKLSQLDEKQVIAKKENVDLLLLCQDVAYMLEKVAENNHISMEVKGNHIYVDGVSQILSEMVYNLCDNAIKYNKAYGTVKVNVYEEDGRPAVSVEDTGIGIPKEDLDRVFERFFRVNKSHSKEIGGTGLGLSIVKHGAAYHNAQIKIDSMLGEGTKITVIF